MQGVIVFYDRRKSMGFIQPDDIAITDDAFFHRTAVVKGLRAAEGMHVEFEIGEYKGKPCAINIKLVSVEGMANAVPAVSQGRTDAKS